MFKVVPCPRLDQERMVVATKDFARGELIIERDWMERTTFMITNQDEAADHVRDTPDAPAPTTTFNASDSQAIGGGMAISRAFECFTTPANLQMACSIILRHHFIARNWVQEGSMMYRDTPPRGIAPMTTARHRVAVQWLRQRGLPTTSLMFWAVRANFDVLYAMLAYNSQTLEFMLSGTVIGLVFCPVLAAFNHDCMPNVNMERLPQGYRMYAAHGIKAGEELCFAYVNSALGLQSLESINEHLQARHGFACACPTHRGTRPLFVRSPPRPLSVVLYRNRGVAVKYKALRELAKESNWVEVRRLCERIWNAHEPLLRSEPLLAFAVASTFCECLPYTPSTPNGTQWTILLEEVLSKYCANPQFTMRSYFFTLIETMHRGSQVQLVDTGEVWLKHHSNEDLVLFLNRWMEIRRYVKCIYGNSTDIINMESHLFRGLYNYFQVMESTVAEMEAEKETIKEGTTLFGSVNLTSNPLAVELGKCRAGVLTISNVWAGICYRLAVPADLMSVAAKPPARKRRAPKKKKRTAEQQRKRKQAVKNQQPKLFIPIQFSDSEDDDDVLDTENMFIPFQMEEDEYDAWLGAPRAIPVM